LAGGGGHHPLTRPIDLRRLQPLLAQRAVRGDVRRPPLLALDRVEGLLPAERHRAGTEPDGAHPAGEASFDVGGVRPLVNAHSFSCDAHNDTRQDTGQTSAAYELAESGGGERFRCRLVDLVAAPAEVHLLALVEELLGRAGWDQLVDAVALDDRPAGRRSLVARHEPPSGHPDTLTAGLLGGDPHA